MKSFKFFIYTSIVILIFSCSSLIEDEDETKRFIGSYSTGSWVYQNDSLIGGSSNNIVNIEQSDNGFIEIFPFHNINSLEHISFLAEIKWEDATTVGIIPFNIINKTINPEDGNTVEIIVNSDGSIDYVSGDQPAFIEGVVLGDDLNVGVYFTHNGGFKESNSDFYVTFKFSDYTGDYIVYIFSN